MAKRVVYITVISFFLSLTAVISFPVQTDAAVDVGWGIPELAEDSTGIAYAPDIAVDQAGNAIVVWYQDDPPTGDSYNNIWTNRYTAGLGWGEAELLENDDSGAASSPRVVMDGAGNAVSVWCQSDGGNYSMWSSRFEIASGWSQPELIEDSNEFVYSPRLAGNANGEAIATWVQSNGTASSIWANHFTNETGWGSAEKIPVVDIGNGSWSTPEVVVDSNGHATAVWRQVNGTLLDTPDLWANRWSEEAGWGTTELIENTNWDVRSQRVAVDDEGNVFVVWICQSEMSSDIKANRYVAGVGWSEEELIEDSTEYATFPEVDTDGAGNAIVVWRQINESDGSLSLWANRYVSGVGWEGPELVEVDEEPHPYPSYLSIPSAQIAIDSEGNACAVRCQYRSAGDRITANHYIAGEGWCASEEIDTEDTRGFGPKVMVDSYGNFMAIWQRWEITIPTYTYTQDIWANRYIANDPEDPVTVAIRTGTEGENGYYLSSVVLELDAIDTISGVNRTMYRLLGENWSQYNEPIELAEDGVYEFEFYSEDLAGNTEQVKNISVCIDTTPPEVTNLAKTGSVSLFAQDTSWYSSEVEVSITASDATSGVESIKYCIDEAEWQTYDSAFTISSNGDHTVECFAIDSAGNNGSIETDHVKVDRSIFLMITSLSDESTVFSSDHLLKWMCSESETTDSGVYQFQVSVDGVNVGTYDPSVREAYISGLSDGRHRIQVVGMDNAGNMGFSTVDIYVHSTEDFALKLVVIMVIAAAIIVMTAFALFKWIK